MKRFVYIGLTVAVGYWLVKTFFFSRQPDRLDAHLTEQSNLKALGILTGNVNLAARPALSTVGARPGDGAISTPFSPASTVTETEYLPRPTGWGAAKINYSDLLWNN